MQPFPLDLARTGYSYIERPNSAILRLFRKHVLAQKGAPRILDVGCGCGTNARVFRELCPGAYVQGIEPNERAAELAKECCSDVFRGELSAWRQSVVSRPFDVVVLSDVLEHIADPITFLRDLGGAPSVQQALWIVSVPNYAVWYNRVRTLLGQFDYAWSGLYDRTHLRFYTRKSVRALLSYAGLRPIDDSCTPSLVQSTAPILRKFFDDQVAEGNHLALQRTSSFALYEKYVEPLEGAACRLWPELLGFQIVTVAKKA